MRGIDHMVKTRCSGGQIKWGHLSKTTCCGGPKTPEPHSGVTVVINPYSGVIVVYSAEVIHSGARSYVPRRANEFTISTRAHMKPEARSE